MRIRYSFSSRRTRRLSKSNKHRIAVHKIIIDIIDKSDILLEVIDARFISETRNKSIENIIKQKGKRIIYVLNKSDLTDINLLKERLNNELSELIPYALISCKDRKGVRQLRDRIKIEAKKINKVPVFVGVIGYPNTGKSSLINTLAGRSHAGVSPKPGFTKGIQKIRLSRGILLFDSPGLIAESDVERKNLEHLKKEARIGLKMFSEIREPEIFVFDLMKKYPNALENFYNIPANGDCEILIENLGRKRHFLKKGNLVDVNRTAREILRDWQEGKIKVE